MTMYLSGPDIRPTGCEPAEFLEAPTFAPLADSGPGTPEAGDDDETVMQQPTARVVPDHVPVTTNAEAQVATVNAAPL
jgi:hypothetical protein